MQIGEAASRAGVSVKAIRHWEDEGLLPPIPRRGRYRQLTDHHVERLRVIAHCREQGFSVPEVRQIVDLLPDHGCPDPVAMRALVRSRRAAVQAELARLQAQATLLAETEAYLDRRVA